jgi:hypothetical protein
MRQERITRKRRPRRSTRTAEPPAPRRLAGAPGGDDVAAADALLQRIESLLRPAQAASD